MTAPHRSVVTLAVGKPLYLGMAINLARSFRHWHPDGRIGFAIATDLPDALPADLEFVRVIRLTAGQFGSGFSPKLHLDCFAPAPHTLFVDSDCLCVGSLDDVFERFAGRAVSVVGRFVSEGEWFGDIHTLCHAIGVSQLPKFNGGVYYAEPGALCSTVYETARRLEQRYDELGLIRLRGRPNDELLMSCAMALHGQEPLGDDGTILSDPQACPVDVRVDVLRGYARLTNPAPTHPLHRSWNPLQETRPALVHFLGEFTQHYLYSREAFRLDKVGARGWPRWAADAFALARYVGPQRLTTVMKNGLRPLYRRLFGTRPIAVSQRL